MTRHKWHSESDSGNRSSGTAGVGVSGSWMIRLVDSIVSVQLTFWDSTFSMVLKVSGDPESSMAKLMFCKLAYSWASM